MTYFTQIDESNIMFFPPAYQNSLDLQDDRKDFIDKLAERIIKTTHTYKTSALLRNYSNAFMQERLINMSSFHYASKTAEGNKYLPESHDVSKMAVESEGETLLFSSVFEYIQTLDVLKADGLRTLNDDDKIFANKDVQIVNQICLYELESILLSHSKVVQITDKNYPLIAMELRIFYRLYDLFMKENLSSHIQNSFYEITKILILRVRITQLENIRDTTEPRDKLINIYNIMIEQIETQELTKKKERSSSELFKKSAAPKPKEYESTATMFSEIELTPMKKTKKSASPGPGSA